MSALQPWPQQKVRHELRSIRKFLTGYDVIPKEFRLKEEEGGFIRPMIIIGARSTRTENQGRNRTILHRGNNFYYYGRDDVDSSLKHEEAWDVYSFLSEVFMYNDQYLGPVIPIWDFSDDIPVETGSFIEFETTTTVEIRKDNHNNWTVPVDLRYNVAISPNPKPEELGPVITEIKRKVIIQ
jgi:hypothetical protein